MKFQQVYEKACLTKVGKRLDKLNKMNLKQKDELDETLTKKHVHSTQYVCKNENESFTFKLIGEWFIRKSSKDCQ